MISTYDSLSESCAFWQSGRDGGSSLLRAAARVIYGIPHYFSAQYIHQLESAARKSPEALAHASTLLNQVLTSPVLTASQWAKRYNVLDQNFAGRGLASNGDNDEKIESRLDIGIIEMPLWGVTLDRKVTQSFGSRFLLEIVEPFPAVAAWIQTSTKPAEQELITGGRFQVVALSRTIDLTHARLSWVCSLEPRPIYSSPQEPQP